jgi:hypothetical protein
MGLLGILAFFAHFFPLFLLGAVFGNLMDDSGSVAVIARFMTERLGTARVVLAVVLAGAVVTYGGVGLFVALFVILPMALGLFHAADIPRRLMPAAAALGTMTFTKGSRALPARATASPDPVETPRGDGAVRERATIASEFDPAEIEHGRHSESSPSVWAAILPLFVVIVVNLAMSLFVLPRLDTSFLGEDRWGGTTLAAVGGSRPWSWCFSQRSLQRSP